MLNYIAVPRITGRQANRDNVPAANPSEYYRLSLFIPFVHYLMSLNRGLLLMLASWHLYTRILTSTLLQLQVERRSRYRRTNQKVFRILLQHVARSTASSIRDAGLAEKLANGIRWQ